MDQLSVRLFGYEEERETIRLAIEKNKSLDVVCLHGPGGIGKTTILRAVHEKYRKQPKYAVTELLDFDNLRLHIKQTLLNTIANQLSEDEELFGNYHLALKQLKELQSQPTNLLRIRDQEERTLQAFLKDYNHLASQKRLILLFDTVEKVQELDLWKNLKEILLQLANTAVLLAGRRNDTIKSEFDRRPASAVLIPLGGLSEEISLEYFKRTEKGQYIAKTEPQQTQLVCEMSQGRPILIDLAVDWLGLGFQLSGENPMEFERGLVEKVSDLSVPLNEVILDMAHVYHYFDARRFSFLHPEYSLEQAQELLEQLSNFSFVKIQPSGGFRLHDEMCRMVEKYVWPLLDSQRTRRRSISSSMVTYYETLKNQYKENQAIWQALSAEQLYHQLYTDLDSGHRAFEPIYRQALSQQPLDFARMLLNTFTKFSDQFDEKLRAWSDIHKGRLLRADEKIAEAIGLIRPAKEKLKRLGVTEQMDTVCNVLGYCYRLLGDWTQAIASFEEALAYSRDEHDQKQIAETMNNLANAARLGGDFERSNLYSLMGLCIREQVGTSVEVGNSCYVRGMVCWETGNTIEAIGYLHRARELFVEAEHFEGIAQVDRYESYMQFRTGDYELALNSQERAHQIFVERGISSGESDTLNLRARILTSLYAAEGDSEEKFKEIEKIAQEALQVAERTQDHYKISECHLTLCRTYYRWGRYYQKLRDSEAADQYYQQARTHYDHPEGGKLAKQRNYFALSSVYEWAMGDIAYDMQDWDTAFKHYVSECEIVTRQKEARMARALNGLSNRLYGLPKNSSGERTLTRQYANYVIQSWKECGLAKDYPEVIEECEFIKKALGLVDAVQLAKLQQSGEDALHRGEWQKATEIYQQLLDANLIYRQTEIIAEAINQNAWAYRQIGDFDKARRLCQQALLIRQGADDPGPFAESNQVMGTIMWTTGNSVEAARYLRIAKEYYQKAKDTIGIARANRHLAFMNFRIGNLDQAIDLANEAEEVFRERDLPIDLADVLNLIQRILSLTKSFGEIKPITDECINLSKENGANYTLAEAWIVPAISHYHHGKELKEVDLETSQEQLELAKYYLSQGYPTAKKHDYKLLQSVYESILGDIAFEEENYSVAFEHYVNDLLLGVKYERARMRRELDKIVMHLIDLPDRLRRFYADYMIAEWESHGLAEAEPDVPRLFELFKEYNEYV
jgi:tetratricopeptide (TPR) repeat protein